jgi:hypothetical protein
MKTWVRKSLKVGVLSAGIILFAGGTAQANEWGTGDNDGVLNGNQILADVDIPVDVCGNAVGVLGDAAVTPCDVGDDWGGDDEGFGAWRTGDNGGLGSGNQVFLPIDVPIDVCGNSIAALGDTFASCRQGDDGDDGDDDGYGEQPTGEQPTGYGDDDEQPAGEQPTGGAQGGYGGEQPAGEQPTGGAQGGYGGEQPAGEQPTGGAQGAYSESTRTGDWDGSGWRTGGSDGLLNSNQVLADAWVPIDVCGNAVGVLGDASASCEPGDDFGGDDEGFGAWRTGDNGGLLDGNQILADLDIPVDLCGTAIGVLGDASASCSDRFVGDDDGDYGDDGDDGADDGADDVVDDVPDGGDDGGDDGMDDGSDDGADDGMDDGSDDGADDGMDDGMDDGADGGDDGTGTGAGAYGGEQPAGEQPTGGAQAYGSESRSARAESLPIFNSLASLNQLTQVLPLGGTAEPSRGAEAARNSDFGGWETGDNDGLLDGNQILADVDVPIDVIHNAVGIGGDAVAH